MNKVLTALPDALIASGGCAVSCGAWLIAPAAGWIVGGLLLIAGGVLSAKSARAVKAED
jgi:hypothetical protein